MSILADFAFMFSKDVRVARSGTCEMCHCFSRKERISTDDHQLRSPYTKLLYIHIANVIFSDLHWTWLCLHTADVCKKYIACNLFQRRHSTAAADLLASPASCQFWSDEFFVPMRGWRCDTSSPVVCSSSAESRYIQPCHFAIKRHSH